MRKALALLAATGVAAALTTLPVTPASADTENCTSRGEWDQLEPFMGLGAVRNLFDVPGRDEGDSADGDYYRYSFVLCWTDDDRGWVWFSYSGLGAQKWRVR